MNIVITTRLRMLRQHTTLLGVLLAGVLVLAACGTTANNDSAAQGEPTAAVTDAVTDAATTEVAAADTTTNAPTQAATTAEATDAPTVAPTDAPTQAATTEATAAATTAPTNAPTEEPTDALTEEPTEVASAVPTEPVTLRSGTFQSANRRYEGSGTASIIQMPDGQLVLQLGSDFATSDGPDLFVGLSGNPAPRDSNQLMSDGYVELGMLQAIQGAQEYALPAGLDPGTYQSVTIYCKSFSVLFTTAQLGS